MFLKKKRQEVQVGQEKRAMGGVGSFPEELPVGFHAKEVHISEKRVFLA